MRLWGPLLAVLMQFSAVSVADDSRAALPSPKELNRYGVALFALPHPKFPALATPSSFGVKNFSFVWSTFGTRTQYTRLASSLLVKPTVLVYAMNESCRRMRRCGQGELLPWMSPEAFDRGLRERTPIVVDAVKRRAREIEAWSRPLVDHGVRVIVSLALEDEWSRGAALTASRILRQEMTGVQFSYNPIGRSAENPLPPGVRFRETHDPARTCRKGEMFTNDGYDLYFEHRPSKYEDALSVPELVDIMRRNERAGCELQFVWWARIQGRENPDLVLAPRKRSFPIDIGEVMSIRGIFSAIR